MRAFGIIFLSEGIKAFLLRFQIFLGGKGRFFLECPVHSFMLSILLRFAGFYLFGINAQFDPPDRKGGESPDGTGSKGHPVVGPYSLWQAIVIEKPGKVLFCLIQGDRIMSLTTSRGIGCACRIRLRDNSRGYCPS